MEDFELRREPSFQCWRLMVGSESVDANCLKTVENSIHEVLKLTTVLALSPCVRFQKFEFKFRG